MDIGLWFEVLMLIQYTVVFVVLHGELVVFSGIMVMQEHSTMFPYWSN